MSRPILRLLTILQLAGVALSAALVVATFDSPEQVESKLRAFAVSKVERAVVAAVDEAPEASEAGRRAAGFRALSDRLANTAERLEIDRRMVTRALIAEAQTDRCARDCEFWTDAATVVSKVFLHRIGQMRVGQTNLANFAADRYDGAIRSLTNDLRRFGLVNLVTLSLMLALLTLRRDLGWGFAALSTAMTAYVAWAAHGYLFEQTWTLAIILNDWAAPGYQVAMMLTACVFADWLFLRARITNVVLAALPISLPG